MDAKVEQHCFRCSCGKSCGEASEFKKILELRDVGLVIYVSHVKTGTDTGMDVFILHNIKDVEIPSRDIQKSLDLCKHSCPRCIHVFERAKKLVKNISTLDKRETMGICKDCGVKAQSYMSNCKCEEIVKKFLHSAAKDNDDIKPKIKMWLDKSNRFLKNFYATDMEDNRLMMRTYSESHLKKNAEDLTGHWSDYNKSHDKNQVSVKSFLGSETEQGKMNFSQNCNLGQEPKVQGQRQKTIIASKPLSLSQDSDENFCRTLAHIKENQDKKPFQFIFPKDKDKKAKTTRPIDSSELIKDIAVQGKMRDNDEKKDKKAKTTRPTDSSELIKDIAVQGKMRDNGEKKTQLEGKDKKTKAKSITDVPSHAMRDNNEKKRQIEGNVTKAKAKSSTDVPSDVMNDRKKRQPKEQQNEKLEQKKHKADSDGNKTLTQDNLKSEKPLKVTDITNDKSVEFSLSTEKEKEKPKLEERNADESKGKTKGKTKENDKKMKSEDLKKVKSLVDQTQKEPAKGPQAKSVDQAKSEKPPAKSKADLQSQNEMQNLLSKQQKEATEKLRKEKEQAAEKEKAKILAEKKLQDLLNDPVNESITHKSRHSHLVFNEEIDEESIVVTENEINDISDIIVGQKIIKIKSSIHKSVTATTQYLTESINQSISKTLHPQSVTTEKLERVPGKIKANSGNQEEGVIRYALSNRKFIDMGWTQLPTEKVVRKMNVYRMHPSHPEFDWFAHNKNKGEMLYNSGEKLAEFTDDGHGRWFYRNGKLALDYYNAEELNAQQRYVVYSTGEPDERGRSRPRTILATFDYLGNGVVFDHTGKIRLKYNQTEGVVLDRSIGPVSHWKWHSLNDPPVLQRVMVDTEMLHKDPLILNIREPDHANKEKKVQPGNDDMLAIEFNNFIQEKSKKLTQTFKPFQIKMKALKINENFSLRILDQATIYLLFRDGMTNLKMNIGMILDHKEIVDTIASDVGDVSNSLEKYPARTASIAALQSAVEAAQRAERTRVRQERRLRRADPCAIASADRFSASTARPLRSPLMTNSSAAISNTGACTCTLRKPYLANIYYDNRILS